MANVVNSSGVSNANSKVAAGSVNRSDSWSFSAADGNALLGSNGDDWANYGKWHLGHASSGDSKTKAYWKYPFGKGGRVYRSGIVAIRQRAGQQGDTAIFEAAGRILAKIDKNKHVDAEEIKGYITDPETGEDREVVLKKEAYINSSVLVKHDCAKGFTDGEDNFEIDILASTPDIDREGDIVEVTAFNDAIGEFMKAGAILYQHNPNELVGVPVSATLSAEGLRVKAFISAAATKVRTMLKEGVLRQASIGFRVTDHDFTDIGGKMHLVIKKLDLFEVSLVSVAANPNTSVSLAKAFFKDVDEDHDALLEIDNQLTEEKKMEEETFPVYVKNGVLAYVDENGEEKELTLSAPAPVEEEPAETKEVPEASVLTQIMQLSTDLSDEDFLKLHKAINSTYERNVAAKAAEDAKTKEQTDITEAVSVIVTEIQSLLQKK